MQQQVAVITLGITDQARARRFYEDGFGWKPVFENDEIIFFQMNGFVLGLWMQDALAKDCGATIPPAGSAAAYAHNVPEMQDVVPLMTALAAAGGRITRPADAPPYGGLRGYVTDPDGHIWEIAYNPAWAIDGEGHVTFGV